jgi:hypothetical protein
MAPAISAYELVTALHVIAVTVAFGVVFAFPLIRSAAASGAGPAAARRREYTVARYLINPGLLVVLAAGIYLASSGHHWKEFFVQWGLAAVIVIGALVGAILIPSAKKAEQLAGQPEAAPLERRLAIVGWAISLIVVVTIVLMVGQV